MSPAVEDLSESGEIRIDESIYPLEIGKIAAYLFTDRARVDIFRKDGVTGAYFVCLTPKKDGNPTSEALVTDYANELLNTSLKEAFTERFASMREEIIISAISNSLREAMITAPDMGPIAEERSIDEVLKTLALEFDVKKSEAKINLL